MSNVINQTTVSTLNLVQSAVGLALTSPQADDPQLWQPTVSVSGTISDPSYVVWVNGEPGANDGDGTWNADNVPNHGQGTATFDASAATGGGSAPANASAAVEMDPYWEITDHNATLRILVSVNDDSGHWIKSEETWTKNYATTFSTNYAGNIFDYYHGLVDDDYTETADHGFSYSSDQTFWWTYWEGWSHFTDSDGVDSYVPGLPEGAEGALITSVPDCSVVRNYFAQSAHYNWRWHNYGGWSVEDVDITVTARTKVKLFTGGKAQVGRQSLFCVNCWGASYSQSGSVDVPEALTRTDIAKSRLQVLGKPVGADGNVWVALPENSGPDMTVLASGVKHYDADATPTKYKVHIDANGHNLDNETPEFCVGQQVTFSLQDLPSYVDLKGQWNLPPKYVNQPTNFSSTCLTYVENDALLQNTNQVSCWFYNGNGGKVSVGMSLLFPNGQSAAIAADGSFTVAKPTIDHVTNVCSGVNMFTNADGSLDQVALQYTNKANGIEMWVYVKRPDHFSGTALMTQLVNRNFHWNANYWPGTPSDVTGGFWLDAVENFAFIYIPLTENGNPANPVRPIYLNDGPFLGAPYLGFHDLADAQDDFHDYVRFQPDGGIPITIGRIDWGWHGKATYSGSAWSLVISTNYINQPDTSDDSFPTWTDVYHGTRGD